MLSSLCNFLISVLLTKHEALLNKVNFATHTQLASTMLLDMINYFEISNAMEGTNNSSCQPITCNWFAVTSVSLHPVVFNYFTVYLFSVHF